MATISVPHSEFLRYLISGLVNTAVGYIAFYVAFKGFDWPPIAANVVSYAVGLLCAFTLNRYFVFRSGSSSVSTALKFLAGFGVAFIVNLAVLHLGLNFGLRAEFAQVPAMASYTVSFYLINKYFVYKKDPESSAH